MFWTPIPSDSFSLNKFVIFGIYLSLHLTLGKSASAESLVSVVTTNGLFQYERGICSSMNVE